MRTATSILLSAVALGLVACGGSSDEPTTPAPATTEATTPPASTEATDTASTGSTGGGEAYPEAARKSFIDACSQSATNEQCECALSYIEENVALDEFIQAGLAIQKGEDPPKEIAEASQKCA